MTRSRSLEVPRSARQEPFHCWTQEVWGGPRRGGWVAGGKGAFGGGGGVGKHCRNTELYRSIWIFQQLPWPIPGVPADAGPCLAPKTPEKVTVRSVDEFMQKSQDHPCTAIPESQEKPPTPRIPPSHLQALCSLPGTLLPSLPTAPHPVSPWTLQRTLPRPTPKCSSEAQFPSPSVGCPESGSGGDAHAASVGRKRPQASSPCVSSLLTLLQGRRGVTDQPYEQRLAADFPRGC